MKWIDIPPVWLIACMVAAYCLPFGIPAFPALGAYIIALGIIPMILAVWEMHRHRTTPIPHMEADALVTTGIFAYSRNPIYLGDLIVLFGFSLRWGSLFGLLLLPALYWVLKTRFIAAEESRLNARFGSKFVHYCTQVRRWL